MDTKKFLNKLFSLPQCQNCCGAAAALARTRGCPCALCNKGTKTPNAYVHSLSSPRTNSVTRVFVQQIEVMFPKGSLDDVQEGTKLLAVLDEDWPAFLEEERCIVRDRMNRWIVPLDEGGRAEDYDAYFKTSIRQVTIRRQYTRTLRSHQASAFKAWRECPTHVWHHSKKKSRAREVNSQTTALHCTAAVVHTVLEIKLFQGAHRSDRHQDLFVHFSDYNSIFFFKF